MNYLKWIQDWWYLLLILPVLIKWIWSVYKKILGVEKDEAMKKMRKKLGIVDPYT